MKIWLDDVRQAPEGWVWVRDAWSVIMLLEASFNNLLESCGVCSSVVDEVSLDHDLGDDEMYGTGYDVLKWLEEQVATNNYDPPQIFIHSANPVAVVRMSAAIKSIRKMQENK
jgi:hypothetical protein